MRECASAWPTAATAARLVAVAIARPTAASARPAAASVAGPTAAATRPPPQLAHRLLLPCAAHPLSHPRTACPSRRVRARRNAYPDATLSPQKFDAPARRLRTDCPSPPPLATARVKPKFQCWHRACEARHYESAHGAADNRGQPRRSRACP